MTDLTEAQREQRRQQARDAIERGLRDTIDTWHQTPPRLDWAADAVLDALGDLTVARQILGTTDQQPTTAERHTGGNAEDCAACRGTTPPYPWICPAEQQTCSVHVPAPDSETPLRTCALPAGHPGWHRDEQHRDYWLPSNPATEQHQFEQDPQAETVRVCLCGKWPDHHIHTGTSQTCGCDTCRAEQPTTA